MIKNSIILVSFPFDDSVIRLHKIVTIPKNLIKRKLGSINNSVEVEIYLKIRQLFDIKKENNLR
jgi:mRNA-degrading endonuclease toxin of MazEF toxin-antitoxin module